MVTKFGVRINSMIYICVSRKHNCMNILVGSDNQLNEKLIRITLVRLKTYTRYTTKQ